MKEFILIRKGKNDFWNNLAPEENSRIMKEFYSFIEHLKSENRLVQGHTVNHGGMQLRRGDAGVVLDGPFVETKEAMLGYVIFRAAHLDEAVEVSQRCPALLYGEKLEVYHLN